MLLASALEVRAADVKKPAPGWVWHESLTAAEVHTLVDGAGLRVVDLRVETSAGRPLFSVAVVPNAGRQARRWGWAADLTPGQLADVLRSRSRSLLVLAAYELAPGAVRLAIVWTGEAVDQADAWDVLVGQPPDSATGLLNARGAWPTRLARYVSADGPRLAVVRGRGPAAGARRRWYQAGTARRIASVAMARRARIVELDRDRSAQTVGAILEACDGGCPAYWRALVGSGRLPRLIDSPDGGIVIRGELAAGAAAPDGTMFPSVSPLGPDDITARVAALLAVTDGVHGLHLQEIGGAALANQNEAFVFEPASAIKIAAHLHVMQQVEGGAANLTDAVNVYQPPASGSCPGNTVVGSETLTKALQEMLWHSDNSRTRVIVDTFGQANINATMSAAGMVNSSINHVIGCGGPIPDTLTLLDAGVLYGGVATGTLIDPADKGLFFSFTAGRAQFMVEGYDWTGLWDTDVPAMILQESPAGMTSSQRQGFQNQMDLGYKAGNYKICTNNDCSGYVDHIAIAGWAQVPFCAGTVVDPREYAFGLFIYNSTSDTTSSQAFTSAKGELLREQIRDGMASCFRAALSISAQAAPDPVLSGHQYTLTLDAHNAGPMEGASITVAGATPAGTTYAGAQAPAGWAISAPAPGGTGPIVFTKGTMAVAESAQFKVFLAVDCSVADGTAITNSFTIASATTPDDDPSDNSSVAGLTVSNPAPVIGAVSVTPGILWPPNHKLLPVSVGYAVADNCGTPACSLSAVSSEPDNGLGDGDTSGDIQIVDDHHVMLRAERAGGGPGRVYSITVTCQDTGGGASTAGAMVFVPHNN